MIRICYIDDVQDERKKYSKRLETSGFRVDAVPPPKIEDLKSILNKKPDLFLIDYELTKTERGREAVTYLGGTLANAIRETMPDHPIVLISRKSLLRRAQYRRVGDVIESFDEIIYKDQIEGEPEQTRQFLASISSGFKSLRQKHQRNWTALLRSLQAGLEETDILLKAMPPVASDGSSTRGGWRVAEAARWVRHVILRYPGVLYDELHAATALGIDLASFRKKRVKELFTPAKYLGIFAPSDGRWWRGRLFEAAQKFIVDTKLAGPASSVLIDAYKRRFHSQLKPARCVYSNETPADWVCYILRKPVKRQFSLPYHPDDRPAVMDEARVSFKAIREQNVLDELFDEEARKLLAEIRSKK